MAPFGHAFGRGGGGGLPYSGTQKQRPAPSSATRRSVQSSHAGSSISGGQSTRSSDRQGKPVGSVDGLGSFVLYAKGREDLVAAATA